MVRMLVIATALVAALGGTAVASEKPGEPQQAKKLDLTGVYLCEGMNPDGHSYRGVVEIAAVESTYLVRWTLDDVEVMGVGIMQGGLLAVSYFGGTPAVVVYRVDADKLVGEWTMGGTEGMIYAETLTRVPEGQIKKPAPRLQPTPRRRPGRSVPIPGTNSI